MTVENDCDVDSVDDDKDREIERLRSEVAGLTNLLAGSQRECQTLHETVVALARGQKLPSRQRARHEGADVVVHPPMSALVRVIALPVDLAQPIRVLAAVGLRDSVIHVVTQPDPSQPTYATSEHEGMIICLGHLHELRRSTAVAFVEVPADQADFMGHRCLMCGVEPSPGQVCQNEDCGAPLHPQWPAVYCCNRCAREDA